MPREIDGFEELGLDMPPLWLRLTSAIRGYWRRELAVLVTAILIGLAAGIVAGR